MDAQHTPGPWRIEQIDFREGGSGIQIVAENGEVIADNQTYYPQELDPKNAPLIAAAPELLNALKDLIALAEQINDASDEGGQLDERYDAALAALAKAGAA